MIFYTADRHNKLSPKTINSLTRFTDITPVNLQNIVDNWFPNGVSSHGDNYFLNNECDFSSTNGQLEIFFELIRKIEFPNKKSRFEASIFATDSEENARLFARSFGDNPNAPIWEVECEEYFKADMKLLDSSGTVLEAIDKAKKYWLGESLNENPFWEYLLFAPVRILRRIS